ncbi:MAG TPA: type IV pilin N-terminal domain-containing protein [Candidatus Thermoplasmatota archaeon]|nr:type IV pilin N-terminal domain-containing protein [Candidatus Thermoplasmatota archaeon]
MVKRVRSRLAASEVIGVVLLLGMTVSMFVILNIYVSSFSGGHSVPLVSLIGTIDKESKMISIENNGGDSLQGTTSIAITIGTTTYQSSLIEILNTSHSPAWQFSALTPDKNPDKWDFGETAFFNFTGIDITDKNIRVVIVDPNKNTIVMSAVLQKGVGG